MQSPTCKMCGRNKNLDYKFDYCVGFSRANGRVPTITVAIITQTFRREIFLNSNLLSKFDSANAFEHILHVIESIT